MEQYSARMVKYPIKKNFKKQKISLPSSAELMEVTISKNTIDLWYYVNVADNVKEDFVVKCFETAEVIDDEFWVHCGTVVDDKQVYHVFLYEEYYW